MSEFTPKVDPVADSRVNRSMSRPSLHKPTLDFDRSFHEEELRLDGEWTKLVESIKREAVHNGAVRDLLLQLIKEPVDELLPHRFLVAAQEQNNLIARVLRSAPQLNQFLDQPADSTVTNSPQMMWWVQIPDKKRAVVVASRRLRFARDLKLLAAGVALTESPEEAEYRGLQITTTEKAQQYPDFFHLDKWKSRNELHDRVYIVSIGDDRLIFKERKTAQHKHVLRHGHVEGNSSLEELATAADFSRRLSYKSDTIRLSVEIPVAAVAFPDGYQFALFEYEEDLLGHSEAERTLAEKILKNFDHYKDEYQLVQQKINQLLTEPTSAKLFQKLRLAEQKNFFSYLKQWLASKKSQVQQVDFSKQMFAQVSAVLTVFEGQHHFNQAIKTLGYSSLDGSQNMYRIIDSEHGKPILEVVGLDFEYQMKETPGADYNEEEFSKTREEEYNTGTLTEYDLVAKGTTEAFIEAIAYYVMRELRHMADTR